MFLEGMRDSMYILYLIPGKLGISQAVAFLLTISAAVVFFVLGKHGKKSDFVK